MGASRPSSSSSRTASTRELTPSLRQALATWAQSRDVAPAAVDNAALRAFVAAEHRRGLSPKSLQRRLSACRSFFRWLLRHGRIEADPCTGVRAPKAARRLPEVLDPDEAKALV